MAQAHDAGIAFAERAYLRRVPQRYDIALATNMGYPADINLYQSVKGMSVAVQGVKEGGVVLLVAECAEGMGQPHFAEMVTWRKSARELLEMVLAPGFAELEQWAIQCQTMVQAKAEGLPCEAPLALAVFLVHLLDVVVPPLSQISGADVRNGRPTGFHCFPTFGNIGSTLNTTSPAYRTSPVR
jgi:hypothetical protein